MLPGALEEVDWLRSKLEMLEKALRNQIPGKPGEGQVSAGEIQLDPDSLVINADESPEADKPGNNER